MNQTALWQAGQAGKAGKVARQARAQKAAKAEWQASREVQQHGRQMEARRIRGIR